VVALLVFAAWSSAEIQRRLDTLYHPFHRSLKRVCDVVKPRLVLAIHSFSPEYEGQKRDIEIGVLVKHEKDRALADKFVEAYAKIGLRVAINEPWSALDGYAFTANSFNSVRCASIMLEFRQDLAVQSSWCGTAKRLGMYRVPSPVCACLVLPFSPPLSRLSHGRPSSACRCPEA
jgi:predicted N-formylglutamate amidohydrolase